MAMELCGLRILIAEDDPMLRRILAQSLERRGNIVISTADGQAAWETYISDRFDLIISDVQMPISTGLDLLKRVRALDKSKPPFVLITGQTSTTEEESRELGATGMLHKPFRVSQLEGLLK